MELWRYPLATAEPLGVVTKATYLGEPVEFAFKAKPDNVFQNRIFTNERHAQCGTEVSVKWKTAF
jgi:hypothetical protein